MASRIDLHTHSTASDGTLSPDALVSKAAELGVRVIAISDHDTTAGLDAVRSNTQTPRDIEIIPAIELNAEGELACHLLGYHIDSSRPVLQSALTALRKQRIARVRAMAERLAKLGFPIDLEAVLKKTSDQAIGRPHLADALRDAGHVRSRTEAFERFLKKGAVAYIADEMPTARQSIQLIRQAGGVPVLAHPSYYSSERLIEQLVECGLMGIEAFYPEHGRGLTTRYCELAQKLGLLVTGGSDYHGPQTNRSALACVDVPATVLTALEEARARV